jgi:hypothetical protein
MRYLLILIISSTNFCAFCRDTLLMVKSETYNNQGVLSNVNIWERDAKGNVLTYLDINTLARDTSKEISTYDSIDRVLKTDRYGADGKLESSTLYHYEKDAYQIEENFYGNIDNQKYIYKLDSNGYAVYVESIRYNAFSGTTRHTVDSITRGFLGIELCTKTYLMSKSHFSQMNSAKYKPVEVGGVLCIKTRSWNEDLWMTSEVFETFDIPSKHTRQFIYDSLSRIIVCKDIFQNDTVIYTSTDYFSYETIHGRLHAKSWSDQHEGFQMSIYQNNSRNSPCIEHSSWIDEKNIMSKTTFNYDANGYLMQSNLYYYFNEPPINSPEIENATETIYYYEQYKI